MDKRKKHLFAYFMSWFVLVLLSAVLNALNVDWSRSHPLQGMLVVVVLTALEASALEFLLMTIVSIIWSGFGGRGRHHVDRTYDHSLTLIINYNLLAHSREDIEVAYKHMYDSFMLNLTPHISAVLLSATNKDELKLYELTTRDNYRALIRKVLHEEGELIIAGHNHHVNPFRLRSFWNNYMERTERDFKGNLQGIVEKVANEFMCIQRVSRVLKKCGQYQDLFLLSEGETKAFSYTDISLYSTLARPFNEPLFHTGEDVDNIHNRQFDYTLIMDGDTTCPPGTGLELLAVAAAHPERGIIQPAIKMMVRNTDTIYMHVEMWRQKLNEPLSRSMAILYDQWGFYGKGMINNRHYIEQMIGTREHPIEILPIDVLSHDTFEAAILKPLYVDSLYLGEEPSYNYVTWHIRERRWNRGELILSIYFWPNICGKAIDFLRRCLDKRNYVKTKIRTQCHLDLVSTHVAHGALRSMFMKPLMLGYIFLQVGVQMYHPFLPLAGVLFIVCIAPKFAMATVANARYAVAETLVSILQYTPEALVGTVRLGQALYATICKSSTENWTPQRVVEEDLRHSNPFTSSIRHLWMYSVVAIIGTIAFAVTVPESNLIFFLFATIIVIPIFTGFTSLTFQATVVRRMSAVSEFGPSNRKRPVEEAMEEGVAGLKPSAGLIGCNTPRGTPQHAVHIAEEALGGIPACYLGDALTNRSGPMAYEHPGSSATSQQQTVTSVCERSMKPARRQTAKSYFKHRNGAERERLLQEARVTPKPSYFKRGGSSVNAAGRRSKTSLNVGVDIFEESTSPEEQVRGSKTSIPRLRNSKVHPL